MFEAIVTGGLALFMGALVIFVSAFAVLAASPLTNEETSSRFASPAMTRLRDSGRVTSGAPVRSGFVNGLVRSLRAARKATRGIQRDTTS